MSPPMTQVLLHISDLRTKKLKLVEFEMTSNWLSLSMLLLRSSDSKFKYEKCHTYGKNIVISLAVKTAMVFQKQIKMLLCSGKSIYHMKKQKYH